MMNRTNLTPLLLLLLTLLLAGCSYNGKVVAGQAVAPLRGGSRVAQADAIVGV